jgi:chaperone required for assembly of F1-ATPase
MSVKSMIFVIFAFLVCFGSDGQSGYQAKSNNGMVKLENNKYIYIKKWTENHFGSEIDVIVAGKDFDSECIKREVIKIVEKHCDSKLKEAFLARVRTTTVIDPDQHYLVKCEPYSEAFFLWTKAGLIDVVTVKFYGSL